MSLLLPLVAVSCLVSVTPMSEVDRIEKLSALVIAESSRTQDVGPELTEALVDAVEVVARRQVGAARNAGIDTPAFRLVATVAIRRELAKIPRSGMSRRRLALNAVLLRATAGELARSVLDGWFGLPPMVRPAVVAPPPRALAAQVTATPVSGPLELDTDAVKLMNEAGGGGNGLIDVEEWVQLTIPVRNRGVLPWFSASAKVVAEGRCIWVDPALQIVPELSPGEADALSLVVYVAGDCPANARRTLTLQIADTHRGSGDQLLRFEVTPQPALRARLVNGVFDVDTLGSSDGSNARALGPGMAAEFSVDVAVDAAVVSARQSFEMPLGLDRLFSTRSHEADAPLVDEGRGTLRAGDDLDVTTVDAVTMAGVIDEVAGSETWLRTGREGSLWLAVDVDLNTMVQTRPEAASGSTTTTTTTEKAKKPRVEASPRAPTDEELIALFDKHVTVVPHEETPRTADALRAFSGYELVLDRAAFAADLMAMRAVPPAAPTSTGPPLVTQRVRLYHALPVIAMLPTPTAAEVPEYEPEAPPPRARKRVPALKDQRPLARIDVGAGGVVGSYPFGSVDRPIAAGTGGARAVVGRDLAGIVGMTSTLGLYNSIAGVEDVTLVELDVEVGGAYRLWLDRFEVAPWVTLGAQRRMIGAPIFPTRVRDSLTVSAGFTGRVQVWEWIGVWADVGVKAAEGGPVMLGTLAGDGIIEPVMFRSAGGVSFAF